MAGENILQTLQRVATVLHQLDAVTTNVDRLTASTTARLDRLEGQMADVRERLARLEAAREADRAQMQAELARFKAEVERAELRLSRMLPEQRTE